MAESKRHIILVTGGAGYIGSACVAALIERGDQVVVFDDLSSGQREKVHTDAVFVKGDITDRAALADVFAHHKFDAVMHFAALKSVEESEQYPTRYFHTNVTGTLNLLAAMEQHGVRQIIFSSTAAVYEPQAHIDLFTEDAPTNPVNVYGRTKLIIEACIKEYARTGIIAQYGVLRYFNVAGDAGLGFLERDARNVFPVLARAVSSGETFNIFGTDYPTKDGTCVRDYIHVSDLVDAHLRMLDSEGSGTYNLGTSEGYSVRELIEMFEKVSGTKLNTREAPRRTGDPASLLADATRARDDLGWTPTRTLEDMVKSTLRIYG